MNINSPPTSQTATTADMADLLIVQLNLWTAIEAIARNLPADGDATRQMDLSRTGMTNALASIVKRHNMNIGWDENEQRDPDPV